MTEDLFFIGKTELTKLTEEGAQRLLDRLSQHEVWSDLKGELWNMEPLAGGGVCYYNQGALKIFYKEGIIRIDTIYQYRIVYKRNALPWMGALDMQLAAIACIFDCQALFLLASNNSVCDAAVEELLRGHVRWHEFLGQLEESFGLAQAWDSIVDEEGDDQMVYLLSQNYLCLEK